MTRELARAKCAIRVPVVIALIVVTLPASAQRTYPPISPRQFVNGSLTVKVTGSASFDEVVALNTAASLGDGQMTWLQFGNSGATTPNATITFTDTNEIGLIVARGKFTAVGGVGGDNANCTGKVDVTPKLMSGQYTCRNVSTHESGTGKMGKVSMDIKFTASSQ